MEENKVAKHHSLRYENEKKITINGVKNVDSFSDKEIVLLLQDKCLVIQGNKFNVTELDVENGTLSTEGEIVKLQYQSEKSPKSFLKKIFK